MKSCLAAACLVFTPALLCVDIAHASEVELTLLDGRVIEGQLDDATDDLHLWVRRSAERIVLANSYRWDEIAAVTIDGDEVEVDKLLANSTKYAEDWPDSFLFAEYEESSQSRGAVFHSPRHGRSQAVASSFVATLANWDRDVEPDGYEIAVTVSDQYGHPMAVRGTLFVTLFGERARRHDPRPSRGELERWSEQIVPEQFAGGPAVFRLPFRQLRPERDLNVAPVGVLQVEVGVFGHGRTASSATVAVREFSPLRSRLQQETGSRFFRGELSERPIR